MGVLPRQKGIEEVIVECGHGGQEIGMIGQLAINVESNDRPWEGWVVLELMGHRRLAGELREQQIGGATFLRLDVPGPDGAVATQFYAPSAVYCITPTTEDTARKVATLAQVAPVQHWEIRPPQLPAGDDADDYRDGGPF